MLAAAKAGVIILNSIQITRMVAKTTNKVDTVNTLLTPFHNFKGFRFGKHINLPDGIDMIFETGSNGVDTRRHDFLNVGLDDVDPATHLIFYRHLNGQEIKDGVFKVPADNWSDGGVLAIPNLVEQLTAHLNLPIFI
jgi:hypothetical protein